MALDISSRGDFMSNMLEEASELVGNLATSNANHCPLYDRRWRGTPNTRLNKIQRSIRSWKFNKGV